jgi:hypothetical protein
VSARRHPQRQVLDALRRPLRRLHRLLSITSLGAPRELIAFFQRSLDESLAQVGLTEQEVIWLYPLHRLIELEERAREEAERGDNWPYDEDDDGGN